eukprot:scaffold46678_cov45-Phaeocystis_antarctica.AAC.3
MKGTHLSAPQASSMCTAGALESAILYGPLVARSPLHAFSSAAERARSHLPYPTPSPFAVAPPAAPRRCRPPDGRKNVATPVCYQRQTTRNRAHAGTGLVGCARVPGEERSEGDADRVARASIAPQHTCSESRHGLASTSLALAAACRRRGSHTLAAARYLHRSTWPLSRRASGPPRPHSPAHMVSSSSSSTS